MSLKVKIFISDMGWGTLSRECAVIDALFKSFKNIKIFLQLKKNKKAFNFFFKGKKNVFLKESENLIKWYPTNQGSIDIKKTKKYYSEYKENFERWVNYNKKDLHYDFFISDIVPEAFYIGNKFKIPTFGICHYTWDWYFSKIIPNPVSFDTIKNWEAMQKKATKFFFTPYTPGSIKKKYKNHENVDFISRSKNLKKKTVTSKKKKILFLDSGENLNLNFFKKIINTYQHTHEYKIFHPESFGKFENTTIIPQGTYIGDKIREFDLIVGRAGFNTMTEILKFKIPTIFLRGRLDPEIDWNLASVIGEDYANYVDPKSLYSNFNEIIQEVFTNKKKLNIKNSYNFNGQLQIINTIKKIIST